MFCRHFRREREEWSEPAARGQDATLLAILAELKEQMGTALDLVKRLEAKHGELALDASDIYPLLQYLEDRGFVTLEPVGDQKVYAVTEAGFAFYEERRNRRATPGGDRDFFRAEGGWRGHRERHRAMHALWHDPRVHDLFHEIKHLGRSFKRAMRHGQLDRTRLERIHAIIARAAREVDETLAGAH